MAVPIEVELVAQDASNACKRGDLTVVIDAVRATTSIIAALANGAKSVIPVQTLREAMHLRKEYPGYLLAGERNGVKPMGFDLDNSPLSLSKEKVEGKSLVMSTTNGTKALVQSRESKLVMLGAFLNASAVAKKSLEIASKTQVGISFVLAGQKNSFALEDFICAGAIIRNFGNSQELSDKALGALLAFNGAKDNLQENVRKSKHAQELLKIGLSRDIAYACQIDVVDFVPIYKDGQISR